MRLLLAFAMLLVNAVIAPTVLAQGPAPPPQPLPHRPRANADELLNGHPMPGSFDELQAILDSGYEVIVRDTEGHKTRGLVSSLSDDQIVILVRERPFFRVRETQRIFNADSVTRIDIVDSTWKGGLIGAAVGIGLMSGYVAWRRGAENGSPYEAGLAIGIPWISIGLGVSIDALINSAIYERPSQGPRVILTPMLGGDVVGVSAHICFWPTASSATYSGPQIKRTTGASPVLSGM